MNDLPKLKDEIRHRTCRKSFRENISCLRYLKAILTFLLQNAGYVSEMQAFPVRFNVTHRIREYLLCLRTPLLYHKSCFLSIPIHLFSCNISERTGTLGIHQSRSLTACTVSQSQGCSIQLNSVFPTIYRIILDLRQIPQHRLTACLQRVGISQSNTDWETTSITLFN